MKVRNKKTGALGYCSKSNTYAMAEVIVYFDEGDCSSEFIKDYDVYLELQQTWKSMDEAFRNRDLIPDNYDTEFREPRNDDERERGWY